MTPADYQHRIDAMEQSMHRLRLASSAAEGQRDRAREIADALGRALRRACDDSKDLLHGRTPDSVWVQSNIDVAERALDLYEEREWGHS